MSEPRPSAFELFNEALAAFLRADIPSAVLLLRGGFFENIYMAPALIGEEFHPQKIWHGSAEGEPRAAEEYVKRYGRFWQSEPDALAFLREIWNDPLVRAELRSFMSLSKNILTAGTPAQLSDLSRERDLFLSPERLRRTQSETLARLAHTNLRLPLRKPRLGLIMLASKDPAASVAFYRNLLETEPAMTSRGAGGYAEFEFEGVHFAIHGHDRAAAEDPYRLGSPPACHGWGAIFVFQVADLDRYYKNAVSLGVEIVDSDFSSRGRRNFVVKDPSGYLLEITEENPRGFEAPQP